MEEMIALVEDYRAQKLKGARTTTAAHLNDVNASYNRIETEILYLRERCNTAALCMVVRTDVNQKNLPHFVGDDLANAFLETFRNVDLHELSSLFEAFCLFHVSGIAKNENDRKTLTKARIGAIVRKGLRVITGDKKAEMSWAVYEGKIVQRYKVHLLGWPEGVAFDLHGLAVKALTKCLDALRGENPTCYWVTLTDEEVSERARAAAPRPPRKQRSDKGKQRGSKRRRTRSPSTSGSSDKEISPQYVDSD